MVLLFTTVISREILTFEETTVVKATGDREFYYL